MIEYNEFMLTAILGLSASVWAIMEAVAKPALKRLFKQIDLSRLPLNIAEAVYPANWRVLGVLLGVGAVVLVGNDEVSFLKMWNIYVYDLPEWVDILVTGVVVGLGDRGIHWLIDWLQANGESVGSWLERLGKSVPVD